MNTLWCSARINVATYYNEKTFRSGNAGTAAQDYEVAEEIVDAELVSGSDKTVDKITAHKMWIETLAPFRRVIGEFDMTNVTSAKVHDAPLSMFG